MAKQVRLTIEVYWNSVQCPGMCYQSVVLLSDAWNLNLSLCRTICCLSVREVLSQVATKKTIQHFWLEVLLESGTIQSEGAYTHLRHDSCLLWRSLCHRYIRCATA